MRYLLLNRRLTPTEIFCSAIIILLSLLCLPVIFPGSNIEKSPVGAAAGDIGAFISALALYQVDVRGTHGDTGPFPATLRQLLTDNAPGWAGPYMATITNDPWNNAYIYTSNGSSYTCSSIHVSEYHKAETIRYCFGTGIMESIP